MALNKKPYKGCRDFFPPQMRERDYIFGKMRSAAEAFAYEAYDGPMLEEVDLYKAKSGEELINDQIYSFIDRGERNVAIRPEMTPTLARMVANIHKQESKPLRWYAIPNLMRYEKPQRGRVREHWQFNVDIFGGPANLAEIEILTLAVFYLKSFGATKEMFQILINDRVIVDSVFYDLLKLNEKTAYALYKVIDNAKKISSEKLEILISEHLTEPSQKEIFSNYLKLNSFQGLILFLEEHKLTEKCDYFINFIKLVKNQELSEYLIFDPTIVRGLDYYTGLVFEVFDTHPENKRAIAGGGSYANLLSIFNEAPLAGVGFGLGDVTMRDFLSVHNLLPDLSKPNFDFILFYTDEQESLQALEVANQLRLKGLRVELHLGKIKFNKLFKVAEGKNYQKIGIIENKDDTTRLEIKHTTTKESQTFELSQISEINNYILGES